MGLRLAEKKSIFYQKIDFSKIRYKNVQYFNLLHEHKPKFGFFATTRYELALHMILSGHCKKQGVKVVGKA